MDMIRFLCPECHAPLRVPEQHAGKRKKCPHPNCGKPILIPLFSEIDEPEPAPEKTSRRSSDRTKQKSASTKSSRSANSPSARSSAPPLPRSRSGSRQGKSGAKSRTAKGGKAGLNRNGLLLRGFLAVSAMFLVGAFISYSLPSASTGDVSSGSATAEAKQSETFASKVGPFLKKYCYDCHGPDLQEEGIRFDEFPSQPDLLADYKLWQKVYQQISVGSMPPSDMESPPPEERLAVAEWLDHALHRFDCSEINNPGRVTVHRLNRNEYDNTIRDLLGLNLNLSKDFPSDDVGYGFDNIGDVLSTSPLLMERYIEAAEKAAEAAIALPEQLKIERRFGPSDFRITGSGNASAQVLTFASNGQGTVKFETRAPGEYQFQVTAFATQAGTGHAQCRVKLNGKELAVHDVPGHRKDKEITWKTQLKPGRHELEVAFINDKYEPDAEDPKLRDRNLYIKGAKVQGPTKLLPEHYPESHRKLVTHTPDGKDDIEYAARKVLQPLLNRAYRRPATLDELDRILRIFHIGQERGESYERSLQIALQGILISPQFLFRIEEQPQSALSKEIHTLGDYELASRLSYFLWSSMPDDRLLDLARQGLLSRNETLEEETRRMLDDPKSQAFVKNFVGQWLGLRKLKEMEPDEELFPEYTAELAGILPRETELLFEEILRQDRSVLEFLTADYTYVNEKLAQHYGIPDVKGQEFQRVSLQEMPRRGFISHAGILTLTSYPDRTSPVKRGEWVLENVLGQAPPPAPNDVPGLEETQKTNPNLSFREQLVLHQKDPICSSCHKLMDGIGFGLQNYDAIGRWRDMEGEFSIDARGDLPGGVTFNGPIELNRILSERPEDFARCLTEKMMTYALGRGMEWYDRCTIDDIISAARAEDYRISRLLIGIVQSPPFRSQKVAE